MRFVIAYFFLPIVGIMPLLRAGDSEAVVYARYTAVRSFPLVCSLPAGANSIYASYIWGVVIDRIVCDGKDLKAEENIILDESARYTLTPKADYYVYIIPAEGHLYVSRGSDDLHLADHVVSYDLPSSWTEYEITYRLRSTNGAISDRYIARFRRLSLAEMDQASEDYHNRLDPRLREARPVPLPNNSSATVK